MALTAGLALAAGLAVVVVPLAEGLGDFATAFGLALPFAGSSTTLSGAEALVLGSTMTTSPVALTVATISGREDLGLATTGLMEVEQRT